MSRAPIHQAERMYCRSGLHRHQAPSPGHKAWGGRVQGSGAQCFCGNCGPILRTEADVAGSARAYDSQLRKEQMFLGPGAAVSFASREVVRSPSESCPRLHRSPMEPSYKKEPKPFLHLKAQYERENRNWAGLVSSSQGERRNPWWLGSHRLERLVSRAKAVVSGKLGGKLAIACFAIEIWLSAALLFGFAPSVSLPLSYPLGVDAGGYS
ncbi:hypothetical protein TGAM01_v203213 [Trichoderma gamsii]|uniref:Uncharacterized protein n=1 Tax=Trichoderma gamsii TaxID=398673 RepID=A0A2P4ZUW0_9HYPO|nr:hypothetical protein TGAM01_v203213 [Trichoderma gamsii]PON28076.1 hypothetical protein TGAM01_v203213 [Trichoderma gamsii]